MFLLCGRLRPYHTATDFANGPPTERLPAMPMFDAKSMLDAIVAGNSQPQAPSQADLSQILSHVLQGTQSGGATAAAAPDGGLGGMLGQILGGAGGQGGQGLGGQGTGGLGGALGQILQGAGGGQGPGGLGGILGQVLGGAGGAGGLGAILGQVMGGAGGQGAAGGLGGAADIARSIFGNATGGVADAARNINQQTGAVPKLDEIIKQISGGQGGGDLLAKAQELIRNNPAAAGALAGVLGSLTLGTGTGRSVAAHAAKLGGLVLIGGLAYKAYEGYRAGQSPAATAQAAPVQAPAGTGFEPQAQTNETATQYIRAMIAAASADGVVDEAERGRIAGGLQQIGHSPEAAAFVQQELAKPASVADLVAGSSSPAMSLQTYAAARVAIEPDSPAEKAFLAQLAAGLGLDASLVQHMDAAATAAKV